MICMNGIIAVAFYTGLRKGEIHALRWEDIEGEHLSVKRSVTQKLNGADRETTPKKPLVSTDTTTTKFALNTLAKRNVRLMF